MIAVDVGYGLTKALAVNNANITKINFPSVIAPAHTDMLNGLFGTGLGYHVKIRRVSGEVQEKLVGEAAQRSVSAVTTMTREKHAGVHDTLVLAGAYLVGAGGTGTTPEQTDLAVGLPLAFYKAQKDSLMNQLQNLAAWVSVDGGPERYISFGRVLVFPQGASIVFAETKALTGNLIGIVDVGTYTTDYLLLEVRNGQPIPNPDGCGSIEVGVHLFHRAIASEFHAQAGGPLPTEMIPDTAKKALDGQPVQYFNREIYLQEAHKARREIGENIAQRILAAWGNRAGHVKPTLLAGGGSLLFQRELQGALPGAQLVNEPIYANARGYLSGSGHALNDKG